MVPLPSTPSPARPWDARIARALILPLRDTRVHPNWLTTVGLCTGLSAATLYARGGSSASLGGVVLVLAMILDHADGELARASGKTSAFGHSYDRAVDLIVKLSTFLGMGLGLRAGPLGLWGPFFGGCAGVALLVIFRSRSALARRRGAAAFQQPAAAGFEIEDILYLIAPITWLGGLGYFVVAAGIGAPLFAGFTLLQLRRAIEVDRQAAAAAEATEVAPAPPLAPAPPEGPPAGDRPAPGSLPALVRPGLVIGVGIFVAIIAYHGAGQVGAALSTAGWGLLAVAGFHLLPLAADALGWRSLVAGADGLAGPTTPPAATFVRARWIGESINGLLPVLQVGGNVAKAHLLTRQGTPAPLACASVVVDVTLVMLTQLFFTLGGTALLLGRLGTQRVVLAAAAGAALTALLVAGFLRAQRSGMFGAGARLVGHLVHRPEWASLAVSASDVDREVGATYGRRRPLATAAVWHLVSWLLGTGEVWLALSFLGHPVTMSTALLLESLGQAVRASAFAIPGALGIQEGGFVVLGGALGIAPEACLALSLTKRSREILLGIPGLIAWQAGQVAGTSGSSGGHVNTSTELG